MKTLAEIARDAAATVESGYYEISKIDATHSENYSGGGSTKRLTEAIREKRKRAVICEVKFSSPSSGEIRKHGDAADIARQMQAGGVVGLSVLTEPKNFSGSISNLIAVRKQTSLPVIMKDIFVSSEQIAAAKHINASAVLFIEEIFSDGLAMDDLSLEEAIHFAHKSNLEAIVETHTIEGLRKISRINADIIGINNRNLRYFETDVDTTTRLLGGYPPELTDGAPLIMSESGYDTADTLKKVISKLRSENSIIPDAFLIGTSVMQSDDVAAKVSEFVGALH